MLTPMAIFLTTRLGIAVIAYLAVPLFLEAQSPPPYHLRPPDNVLVDVFGSRWDTGFYVSIAEEGYRYLGVELPSVAFFPLLPLMMRALSPLVGDPLIAGLLVSNAALLLATIVFYRLVDDSWGSATAGRAVWYMLIFPTAFFGSALYTESLFLLFAIGALYAARRGYWEVAGLLGVAASLTRLIGVIVAVLLFVEWMVQKRNREKEDAPGALALFASVMAPAGTLAYMAYLWRAFGDPLAFVKGAAAWQRVPKSPWVMISEQLQAPSEGWISALLAGRIHTDNWIDLGFLLVFLVLALAVLYRRHWPEGFYMLAAIGISLSSGLLMSQRRYVWVLFPAFVLLARWGDNPKVDRLITALSLMGLALFTALFANGYWVG